MAKKSKKKANKKQSPLPLILIGVGLIVVAAIFMVFNASKKGETAANNGDTAAESAPAQDSPAAPPKDSEYPPAPELTLTDLAGNQVSLADYRGHWLLVNNWATWCPPCRAEMPELNAYYLAHKDEGFVLIGISAGDAKGDVQSFVQSYKIEFPIWLDPQQKAMRAFQRNSLPNSFIIDPDGYIRMSWTGGVTLNALEEHVTPLIQGE